MLSYQYDLFNAQPTELDILRKEFEALQDSQNRQRKNLFAKHADLAKIVMYQQKEIDRLSQLLSPKIY